MSRLEEKLKKILDLSSDKRRSASSAYSHIEHGDVVDFLEAGLKMPEIAAIYNCSVQTIRYQIRIDHPEFDARKYVRWGKVEITDKLVEELYSESGSCTKVSRKLDLSESGVVNRLKRAGVKRKSRRREDITTKQVVELYEEHGKINAVARILNVSSRLVKGRLNEAEIPTNLNYRNEPRRTDIKRENVLERYDNGESIRRIADYYDANCRTIRRILQDEDRKIRTARETSTRADITPEKVAAVYRVTKRITYTARLLGTSTGVICKRLESMRVKLNDRMVTARMRSDIPENEVIRRRKVGETLKNLAKRFDTTEDTILRLLDYHKVPRLGRNWRKGKKSSL